MIFFPIPNNYSPTWLSIRDVVQPYTEVPSPEALARDINEIRGLLDDNTTNDV